MRAPHSMSYSGQQLQQTQHPSMHAAKAATTPITIPVITTGLDSQQSVVDSSDPSIIPPINHKSVYINKIWTLLLKLRR